MLQFTKVSPLSHTVENKRKTENNPMYINKKRVSLPDTAGTYLAYALVDLMEKKPLEEISITELTKKAGVSRMSYYRSFDSKQHILEEHLQTIVRRFRIEGEKEVILEKNMAMNSCYMPTASSATTAAMPFVCTMPTCPPSCWTV
jgi:AcrR family transcriptional regulator